MIKTLNIHDQLFDALSWSHKTHGCTGCKSADGSTDHDPICEIAYLIDTNKGTKGSVVILDPHPATDGQV